MIHISGAPAAGKTKLGKRINRQLHIPVKDTDEFIQPENEAGKFLASLSGQEHEIERKRIFARKIGLFLDQHKNAPIVVFVGLLDHYSKEGNYFAYHFDEKFYLDVPMQVLLCQYYKRVYKDTDDWPDIAAGVSHILSSTETIYFSEKTKSDHVNMGYKVANVDQIWNRLNGSINCTICGTIPDVPLTCKACRVGVFCGKECGRGHYCPKSLQYLSTGYINGTRINRVLTREGNNHFRWTDRQDPKERQKLIDQKAARQVWRLAQQYVESGEFHLGTDKDKPECCDKGIVRVWFGKYAADPRDVPDIVRFFEINKGN